jgi:hypothetical protein
MVPKIGLMIEIFLNSDPIPRGEFLLMLSAHYLEADVRRNERKMGGFAS